MALFGSNKEPVMAKQISAAAPGQINMVGEGTVFDGTLSTEGDIRVSGRILGKIRANGKVIVAQEGAIDGELVATYADVAGLVQGEIQVEERLILKATARVEGNVRTGRLVMEEGAVFNGKCLMGTKAGSGDGKPVRSALQADGSPARLVGAGRDVPAKDAPGKEVKV